MKSLAPRPAGEGKRDIGTTHQGGPVVSCGVWKLSNTYSVCVPLHAAGAFVGGIVSG